MCVGAVVLAAAVAALVAAGGSPLGGSASFVVAVAAVVGTLVATGLAAYRRASRSLRMVAISPFAIAAVTWSVLYVLRPLELYVWPDHAAWSVAQFGFDAGELARTTALAALGCAAWCLGYLTVIGRASPPAPPSGPSARRPLVRSWPRAAAILGLGAALVGALFMRQGGPAALLSSPASIRVNQGASFYAFVGVFMISAVAVCAFRDLLLRPTRRAKVVFATAATLTFGASMALQLRGLLAFTLAAAYVLFLRVRQPSKRLVAAAVVAALAGAVALAALQMVRSYTQTAPTREAVSLATRTPVWAMFVSDLSTYDNFLALQQLVPESVGYLDGESIANVPTALVPRSLWPEKPLGLEFEVSALLYPGVFVAVPIAMQGELYWNGGIPAVALGAFVLGLIMGLYGRVGLRAAPAGRLFVAYALGFAFVHVFLRSALATMFGNFVLACAGATIVAVVLTGWRPWELAGPRAQDALARLRQRGAELSRAH